MSTRWSFCSAALIVALFGIARSVDAAMYMKVDNLVGDSKDQAHGGWSDLSSLQLLFHSDCASQGGGGGASCPATTMTARFGMTVDSSVTLMLQRELAQTANNTITVEAFNGNNSMRIDRYEFMGVRFGDLSVTYGSNAPGQLVGFLQNPLHFKAIHYLYDPNSGQPLGSTTTMWGFPVVAGQATAPIPGDYDVDGDVDGQDYQVWRGEFGFVKGTIGTGADGNADGLVDAADYVVWRDNLWTPILASGVPEPAAATLVVMGAVAVLGIRRRIAG